MNVFNNIQVSSAELDYVIGLSAFDRIQYLFEVYDIEVQRLKNPNLNLRDFFNELETDDVENETFSETFDAGETGKSQHRVDVMVDDQNILIESNSLKALRIIKSRFIENGFILWRDKETEKMFKRDKITKYLRVFKIVSQIDPICYN